MIISQMKRVHLNLKPIERSLLGDWYTVFKFSAFLETEMDDALFDKIDDELAAATDDFIRLDYEFGGFGIPRGIYVSGHYASPEQIFAASDVLFSYGYNAIFDEDLLIEDPCSDMPEFDEE